MRADKLKQEFIKRQSRKGVVEKEVKPATLSWGYPDRVVIAETDAGKITVSDLQKIAREKGVPYSGKNKAELIEVLSDE